MSSQHSRLVARRGQLMAELLLLDLGAKRIFRQTNDDPECEYRVIFEKEKEDPNTLTVKLKSTVRPPGKRIQLERSEFEGLPPSNCNLQPLLIVADVKQNQMHYAWLPTAITSAKGARISVPLIFLDDSKKAALKRKIQADISAVAVAG